MILFLFIILFVLFYILSISEEASYNRKIEILLLDFSTRHEYSPETYLRFYISVLYNINFKFLF